MSVFCNRFNMYSIVILSIVVVAVSAGDMNKQKCKHFMNPRTLRCCSVDLTEKIMMTDEIKSCLDLSKDPHSCASELCMAKNRGFATADEKIDKAKLIEVLTNDFGSVPTLVDAMTKSCVDTDLSEYGAPDFCDFVKLRNCLTIQLITYCPEWSKNDECNGVTSMVEECKKLFA